MMENFILGALITIIVFGMFRDSISYEVSKARQLRYIRNIANVSIPKGTHLESQLRIFYSIVEMNFSKGKAKEVFTFYVNRYAEEIDKISTAYLYKGNDSLRDSNYLYEKLQNKLEVASFNLTEAMIKDLTTELESEKAIQELEAEVMSIELGIENKSNLGRN